MIRSLETLYTCDGCDGPCETVIIDNRHKGKGCKVSLTTHVQMGRSTREQHFCFECLCRAFGPLLGRANNA
jgi:hypothetical protein